jgi:hypothetical protein
MVTQKVFLVSSNYEPEKDCTVCSNRKIKGGRRETVFYCNTCTRKPGLHSGECFEKYHSHKKYKYCKQFMGRKKHREKYEN